VTNSSWVIPSRSGWLVIIGFVSVSMLLLSPPLGNVRSLSPLTVASAIQTPPCVSDQDCADDVFCNGIERCNPSAAGADARGCVASAALTCGAGQRCDEDGRRCVTSCVDPDHDQDGHRSVRCGGDDCDDRDANRYPGRMEVCDAAGHDEDCNPLTYGQRDVDGDSEDDGRCSNREANGTLHGGTDYDDGNPAIRAGSMICDGPDAVVVFSPGPSSFACPPETKCVVQPNKTGICVVPPASYAAPGRFVPPSTPAELPTLGTLLSSENMSPTGAGQASAQQTVDSSAAVARVLPAETVSAGGSAAEVAQCKTILQSGKVSWGGGTSWAPGNIDRLCDGTKNAKETIACFQSIVDAVGWAAAIDKCK